MALESVKILAWDDAGKKLYTKTPGNAWEEWSSQPTVAGTAAYGMTGVPDGSILTQNPADWEMLHWDPNLSTWIDRGHPGILANFNYAVWAGTQDIILGGGLPTGRVAIYDGASQTWTDLGSRGAYTIRPAQNCTLNDIWCVGDLSGDGEIFHWDGAIWTTHRADMVSQIGDPGRTKNCDRIGNNLYVINEVYGSTSTLNLAKRNCDTGVWTLIGSCVGYAAARGMRAASDNCIYIGGNVGTGWGFGTQIYKWNGSTLNANKYLGNTAAGNLVQIVGVVDNSIAYCYYGPTNTLYETLDGGANWADTTYPGTSVSAFSSLWEPRDHSQCTTPKIGSDFSLDHYLCLPRQHVSKIGGRIYSSPFSLGTSVGGILRTRTTAPSSSIDNRSSSEPTKLTTDQIVQIISGSLE